MPALNTASKYLSDRNPYALCVHREFPLFPPSSGDNNMSQTHFSPMTTVDPVYVDSNGVQVYAHAVNKVKIMALGALMGQVWDYLYTVHKPGTPDFDDQATQLASIQFQNGAPSANGFNGVSNEAMIAIVRHRLVHLDKTVSSAENQQAIRHLDDALAHLDARTLRRRERGVIGTDKR